MPLPYQYSETLHFSRDQIGAEAIWSFFADRECIHRVLPDGRCDIILRFQSDGAKLSSNITPIVTGAATRFHFVPVAAGTGYVGVRLRPGTAGEVLGIEARTIAQRALVGDAALTIIPEIQALCLSVPNVDALVERLTDFVASRMHGISVDPSTESMINMLHVTGGRLPVGDIGRLHGVDVRTVQRRIVSATGLTPKQMAMVVQFHRALRLRFYDRLDIVSTAIEAGYADQAHMSRVFRHMGGFSPARLPDLVLAGFPI